MPMLQAASTHLIIPEPSEDLLANEPWSIEIYADGLMDELFADIDEVLDFSGNLPSQTVRNGNRAPRRSREEIREWFYKSANPSEPQIPADEQVQTVNVPQIVLPSTLKKTGQAVTQVRKNHLSTVVLNSPTAVTVGQTPQLIKRSLGKLMILGTTIGVAIAGTLYLVHSGVLLLLGSRLTQPIYVPQSQSQLYQKPEVEAELIDYMLGALTVIDQQGAINKQQSVRPGFTNTNKVVSSPNTIAFANTQPASNLSLPLGANNTPLTPNRSGSVVERIYIPVYQAPSPMRYAPPPIPGTPRIISPLATNSQTSQLPVVKTALNQVKQAAKPVTVNRVATTVRPELKPVPVRTAPITVRQQPNPLPSLPVVPFGAAVPNLSAATAPTSSPATQQQTYSPTSTATISSHTLEGLLESGKNSVALFQVDGVTRRVNIGESIGSSGWTLVDVSNGEAVIRRNGEVRSIYAGQKL